MKKCTRKEVDRIYLRQQQCQGLGVGLVLWGSVRIMFRVVFRVRVSLTVRFRGLLRNGVVVKPEIFSTAEE